MIGSGIIVYFNNSTNLSNLLTKIGSFEILFGLKNDIKTKINRYERTKMGCDIYNHTVLRIQHTEKNVTLDEIIVLESDSIYLGGIQYDERYKNEDFLEKDFSWDLPNLIYNDGEFIDIFFDEKYRLLIEERIGENKEYYCDRYPLDYEDDGSNFVNNRFLSSMKNITKIHIDTIKRWRM